jgi:membrane protease YdiL (CAAX protease family)
MYDSHSKGISYTAGFFILIAFAIAGILISDVISRYVWSVMTGLDIAQFTTGMTNPANASAYKVAQVIIMLGILVPAHIVASMLSREPLKLLGLSERINSKQVGMVVLITGAALLVGGGLSYINHEIPIPANWKAEFDKLEASYKDQAKTILDLKTTGDYIIALIVMGFLPAFCEETLFRGGMQNFLTRGTRIPWLAIIIASLIFSLAHFSFYGFLFRFLLGAVLGLIYHYSGRLWLSILAHFINNALVVTIYFVYTRQGKSIDEVMNQEGSSYWGLLALPLLILLFVVYRRMNYGSAILSKQTDN